MTEVAAEAKTIVTDIRGGVENAFNWLKEVVETHIPAAEADWNAGRAELQKLQSDEIVQAAEAAVLTPGERSWVAKLIADIPALRVKPAGDVPAEAGSENAAGDIPSEQSAA